LDVQRSPFHARVPFLYPFHGLCPGPVHWASRAPDCANVFSSFRDLSTGIVLQSKQFHVN
jgi:hypothetical protein